MLPCRLIDGVEMSKAKPIPQAVENNFEVFDWRHGLALWQALRPNEWNEVISVLEVFQLNHSDIAAAGGNKSSIARKLDGQLIEMGWVEKKFDTRVSVDGVERVTPTHSIDCFKNGIALEVEWNNKDPFFDRDLNNFRLLYDLNVVDVGVIITRSSGLKNVLALAGRQQTTFGASTTHMEKLLPKIMGGGAGGCPVVVFGIKPEAYKDDR